MMNRLLFLFAALLTVMPASAQNYVDIVYDGDNATISVPSTVTGLTYNIKGANVSIVSTTLVNEYTYRLSGSSPDGSLTINGNYKLTLQLSGLDLTNAHGGPAIDIECGKRIAVVLEEGTVNTLCDSPSGDQKGAFFFKGHAELEGGGTLNVTGKLKHAICAKEYMEVKSSTGAINILGAVSDGIHCGKGKVANTNNYFEMSGGTVNIVNAGSDGIDADDFGVVRIKGGALSINVADSGSGIKADSTLTISGGNINIHVAGNDADGLRSNYAVNITGGTTDIYVEGDGSKGIKSKNDTETTATVSNGGDISISGGTIRIEHLGDTYADPSTGDTSSCVGIAADNKLVQTDGEMEILSMGTDCQAYRGRGGERLEGGTLKITRIPWKVKTRDYQYDMTVYGAVQLNGSLLADYSEVAIGAFDGDVCIGYADFEPENYGIIRLFGNEVAGNAVSFKYFDWTTMEEATLAADRDIAFETSAVYGTPSNPVILSDGGGSILLGDINGDGEVNVTDVMAGVGYILGNKPEIFIFDAADINNDGEVNVTDIMHIVNIILN